MLMISALVVASLFAAQGQPGVRSGPVWRTLPAISHGNLAVYPVVYAEPLKTPMSGAYITLDEGLKAGTVEVTEKGESSPIIRSRGGQGQTERLNSSRQQTANQTVQQQRGGAQVNELWLTNKSGKKLVLLAGEMVVGGQQDRIVQRDMIIPPSDKPVAMNVFCVEQGRWSGEAKFGAPATAGGFKGAVADPSVRGAAQGRGQQEVWANVASKNAKSGASGAGTTYQMTLKAEKNRAALPTYQKAFERFPMKDTIGAVIAVNGHVIWADVFVDASMFGRYWTKLLQSYIVEANTENLGSKVVVKHPTVYEAQGFLNRISGTDKFEGTDGVYKLVMVDGKGLKTFELYDIANGANLLVHFNKMLQK